VKFSKNISEDISVLRSHANTQGGACGDINKGVSGFKKNLISIVLKAKKFCLRAN